jgi:hypothetical protein
MIYGLILLATLLVFWVMQDVVYWLSDPIARDEPEVGDGW